MFKITFSLVFILVAVFANSSSALSEEMKPEVAHMASHRALGPNECAEMEVWDFAMAMCMPLPMKDMPMTMLMVQANSFATESALERPRGRDAFAVPNMFMVDLGTTVGEHHYLNVDFMGTLEKWTLPKEGYPELLQIGENRADGTPFLDSQHPHSSPIMGLTLSDTIAFGQGRDHAKLWFAPRGQSTDGPVAFMHRPTGMVNPDAPLGHHIGQDVGHISSTVVGASVKLRSTTLEISTFHGLEPEPTKVDLPLGQPDSYALRLIEEWNPHLYAMTSLAYVKNPELHDPDLDHIWRYSASFYADRELPQGWLLQEALIWGLVNGYDHASALNSFAEEFWVRKNTHSIWSRIEVLQRTPAELQIASVDRPDVGRWVTALTIGYTHELASCGEAKLSLGGSVTKDILPGVYRAAYGGDPLTARVFLQLGGMKMWEL